MVGPDGALSGLDNIRAEFDKAMLETDKLARFRALQTVFKKTKKLQMRLIGTLKGHEKTESNLEAEKRFVGKHDVQLELLAQSLFRCYQNPGKARENLDRLCEEYGTKYTLNVLRLGVWRLARPVGIDLLGIKTESRRVAEQFYENALLPLLEAVVPYHRDYLKLKRIGVERRYEKILDRIEVSRKAVAMVEAVLKKYQNEVEIAAMGLSDENISSLTSEEKAERMKLLPTKMREAVLEAQREANKKPHGAI